METIWKYELEVVGSQEIKLPTGFEVLSVQVQNGIPCLWVRVDALRPTHKTEIIIHGTGHPVPDTTGKYLGTFQMNGGALVWHVFLGNTCI